MCRGTFQFPIGRDLAFYRGIGRESQGSIFLHFSSGGQSQRKAPCFLTPLFKFSCIAYIKFYCLVCQLCFRLGDFWHAIYQSESSSYTFRPIAKVFWPIRIVWWLEIARNTSGGGGYSSQTSSVRGTPFRRMQRGLRSHKGNGRGRAGKRTLTLTFKHLSRSMLGGTAQIFQLLIGRFGARGCHTVNQRSVQRDYAKKSVMRKGAAASLPCLDLLILSIELLNAINFTNKYKRRQQKLP